METPTELISSLNLIRKELDGTVRRINNIVTDGGILSKGDIERLAIANGKAHGAVRVLSLIEQHKDSHRKYLAGAVQRELDSFLDTTTGSIAAAKVCSMALMSLTFKDY